MLKLLKLKLLLVLTLLSSQSLKSQINGNWYIDWSFGMSNPLGVFSSRNLDLNNPNAAGFAKFGFASSLSIGYDLPNGFGLIFKSQTHTNIFNADDYAKEFGYKMGSGRWIADGTFYSTSSFMLGIKKHWEVQPKSSFDIKLLGGWVAAKSPNIELYSLRDQYWWVDLETYTNTVGFQIGVGYEYKIKPKISVIANVDYFGATAEFGDIAIYAANGKLYTETKTLPIHVLNSRLGLLIYL
jgi:hypothetical protein